MTVHWQKKKNYAHTNNNVTKYSKSFFFFPVPCLLFFSVFLEKKFFEKEKKKESVKRKFMYIHKQIHIHWVLLAPLRFTCIICWCNCIELFRSHFWSAKCARRQKKKIEKKTDTVFFVGEGEGDCFCCFSCCCCFCRCCYYQRFFSRFFPFLAGLYVCFSRW